MKLLRVAIACSVLGLAGWAPPVSAADNTPKVELAQYARPYHRHRYFHRRYYRHRRYGH